MVRCCTCCILMFISYSLCSIGCAAEAPKHHRVTFHAASIYDYWVLNNLGKMRGRSLWCVLCVLNVNCNSMWRWISIAVSCLYASHLLSNWLKHSLKLTTWSYLLSPASTYIDIRSVTAYEKTAKENSLPCTSFFLPSCVIFCLEIETRYRTLILNGQVLFRSTSNVSTGHQLLPRGWRRKHIPALLRLSHYYILKV
jgi:hypothetical protein